MNLKSFWSETNFFSLVSQKFFLKLKTENRKKVTVITFKEFIYVLTGSFESLVS